MGEGTSSYSPSGSSISDPSSSKSRCAPSALSGGPCTRLMKRGRSLAKMIGLPRRGGRSNSSGRITGLRFKNVFSPSCMSVIKSFLSDLLLLYNPKAKKLAKRHKRATTAMGTKIERRRSSPRRSGRTLWVTGGFTTVALQGPFINGIFVGMKGEMELMNVEVYPTLLTYMVETHSRNSMQLEMERLLYVMATLPFLKPLM